MALTAEFSIYNVTPFHSSTIDPLGNEVIVDGTVTFVPRPKPTVGMASGTLAGFEALAARIGPVKMRRSYSSTAMGVPSALAHATFAADPLAVPSRVSMWSFKPDVVRFASGVFDAEFKALLKTIKHRTLITLWHEPGSEFRAKTFSPDDWKRAITRMGRMIKESTSSQLISSYINLEGAWAFNPVGFGGFNYWSDDFDSAVDYIGFDQYAKTGNRHIQDYLTERTANMSMTPMNWARHYGKPVIIPEWGVSDSYGQDVKCEIMESFWAWCKAQPDIEGICYFNNNLDIGADADATWAVHGESEACLKGIIADSRIG